MLSAVLAACAVDPKSPPAEIQQRIEAARTRADHEGLATYYDKEASSARAIAADHRRMAKSYGAAPATGRGTSMSAHCNAIVRQYEGIAVEFDGLAAGHRQMAAGAQP
jgi:hypothetical protein